MPSTRPRVLVLGTGAMATTLGAHLARRPDADVTLAGTWMPALEALRQHGAAVEDATGTWTGRVAAAPLAAAPEADVVLVLVKSAQNGSPAVQRAVAHAAEAGTLVVTLQNGLGNREALEAAAGPGRVAVGVATLGATLVAPGRARAFPGEMVLGLEGRPQADDRLRDLARLLSGAGLPARTSPDVRALLWGKLAVNCAINPLAALTGLTNGALLEHPRLRALLGRAAREVADVASAVGIPLEGDAVARAEAVAASTGGNRASMLQDLQRGAPTEIDALCGAVAGRAARHGVRVPVNDWLWRSVRAREATLAARSRRTA